LQIDIEEIDAIVDKKTISYGPISFEIPDSSRFETVTLKSGKTLKVGYTLAIPSSFWKDTPAYYEAQQKEFHKGVIALLYGNIATGVLGAVVVGDDSQDPIDDDSGGWHEYLTEDHLESFDIKYPFKFECNQFNIEF
jgi:hypothetical protein